MSDNEKTEPTPGPSGAKPRPNRQMESQQKKENKRRMKAELKDKRTYANVMKGIGESWDVQDKFNYLSEKYKLLYDEVRNLEANLDSTNTQMAKEQQEKQHLTTELGKADLLRTRLENISRALQAQNKELKDKILLTIQEEEDKRLEVSSRFQKTFDDLNTVMQDSNSKNLKLQQANTELAEQLQLMHKRAKQVEEQMDRMRHQVILEKQLCDSNIAKEKLHAQVERELWNQERDALQMSLKKSEEVRTQLQANAKVMQDQIHLYIKKCDEFEKTINKSNKLFEKCRTEMMSMNTKMMAMEKDSKTWKDEWMKRDQEAEMGKKKIARLEKLCRDLQRERNDFLKLLKNNNINIPSATIEEREEPIELPPSPTPKEEELELLKTKLADLQLDLEEAQAESGANAEAVNNTEAEPAKDDENMSRPSKKKKKPGRRQRQAAAAKLNASAKAEMGDGTEPVQSVPENTE